MDFARYSIVLLRTSSVNLIFDNDRCIMVFAFWTLQSIKLLFCELRQQIGFLIMNCVGFCSLDFARYSVVLFANFVSKLEF